MAPESLRVAIRDRPATSTGNAALRLDRVFAPAFEHLALGCGLAALRPDLALYELRRARHEELQALEEVVLRGARSLVYMKAKWHYHALDELDALERRVPEAAATLALLGPAGVTRPGEEEALLAALVHVLRHPNLVALGREAEARRELEAAGARLKDRERLRAVGHLLTARLYLDDNEFKKAAAELKLAAEALERVDPKAAAEIRARAAEVERALPDSTRPGDLVAFAGRVLFAEVARATLGEDVASFAGAVQGRTNAQIEDWQKAFPSADELREKALGFWPGGPSGTAKSE
jgi:hypothetical protein